MSTPGASPAPAPAATPEAKAAPAGDKPTEGAASKTDGNPKIDPRTFELAELDLTLKQRARALDLREKAIKDSEEGAKTSTWAQIQEALAAGDRRKAAKLALGDKYDNTVLYELAQDFADQAEAEGAPITKEQAKALAKEALEEERAAEAKKKADDEAAAQVEGQKALDEQFVAYVQGTAAFLKANAEKFPLCSKWAHRVSAEDIIAAIRDPLLKERKVVMFEEVLAKFEEKFRAELELVSPTKKPEEGARRSIYDDVDAAWGKAFPKVQVQLKDPSKAPMPSEGAPRRRALDEIYEQLDREDAERKNRLVG